MGDNAADDAPEQQITFTIKSSSDQKFSITVSTSITVGDLKAKLSTSEYANIPPERQRLIYSGRVLKDPDTLATCKIKEGNTIHLVKSAESTARQNPAGSGGSTTSTGATPVPQVPTNIAAGSGAHNPLAQLTGARYAGMHGLPSMDMFGADGGMGAPPNPDQMLRLLDDPNFAQQMNEAMNNPAVIDMLRNNPMIRNNPMARAAIDNPELRRMMLNPQMIRMQMEMQRAIGGGGGGQDNFPMPGQTDTTPAGENATAGTQPSGTGAAPSNPFGGANPFAQLFPGMPSAGTTGTTPAGNTEGGGAGTGAPNPQEALTNMLRGMQGAPGSPSSTLPNNFMNDFYQQMMMGGGGGNESFSSAPPDNRPPEERFAEQLRQLNDMGFFDFERNVQALRRSGGSVQGAIEHLLSGP